MINEVDPVTLAGISAAGVAANIAHQVYQAKRRTTEKIRQAGLGHEYDKTKKQLGQARRKQLLTLGLSGKAAGQKAAAKTKLQDIKNKGLHQYQTSLSGNPHNQEQARKTELSSGHPH
jgi:hypothetical protein